MLKCHEKYETLLLQSTALEHVKLCSFFWAQKGDHEMTARGRLVKKRTVHDQKVALDGREEALQLQLLIKMPGKM